MPRKRVRKVQTTLRLPKPLYAQAKARISAGQTDATSVNDLVVMALQSYLRTLRRKEIDDSFAAMATDRQYLEEAERIAEEFAYSDWEALQIAEKSLGARRAEG